MPGWPFIRILVRVGLNVRLESRDDSSNYTRHGILMGAECFGELSKTCSLVRFVKGMSYRGESRLDTGPDNRPVLGGAAYALGAGLAPGRGDASCHGQEALYPSEKKRSRMFHERIETSDINMIGDSQ